MKFNVDKAKTGKILDDIDGYIRELEREMTASVGKTRFYSTSMVFFSTINRCIDLGNEIISAGKFGMPTKYREIFDILYDNKIITQDVHSAFVNFVHLRNLIAHKYHRINEKGFFKAAGNKVIIRKFVSQIRKCSG